MDNIQFEKIWQEEELIELKISASSQFASAFQTCYVGASRLQEIANSICSYINCYRASCYLEFGEKEGEYTPAFSMCILPADASGHMKIEVDIEIADNDMRSHRCCFYVNSELGSLEQLGIGLSKLALGTTDMRISLY